MTPTFKITRRERTRTGKDARGTVLWEERWVPVKRGLTQEQATRLVELAAGDSRTTFCTFRVEEER